jgi:hypothetical protein
MPLNSQEPQSLTPSQLVDELTYRCYEFNRRETPGTTPEQWSVIFGPKTHAMEERYQHEIGQQAAELYAEFCEHSGHSEGEDLERREAESFEEVHQEEPGHAL